MDKRIFTVGSLIPGNIVNIEAINSNLIDAESITTVAHQLQKIGLVQNQKKFEIQPIKGKLLLDAAIQQGQDLKFKCRKGTCGVCTVKIIEGASHILSPNEKEKKKLKMTINQGDRLACQSMIQ